MHIRANRSASAAQSAVLLPVCLTQTAGLSATSGATVPAAAVNRATRTGVIELDIAGVQLRLRGAVDEASLRSVLRALRHSA